MECISNCNDGQKHQRQEESQPPLLTGTFLFLFFHLAESIPIERPAAKFRLDAGWQHT